MNNSSQVIKEKASLSSSDLLLKKALEIRQVEQLFLHLFSQGQLNGTVHTCVGQEFSGLAFAGQLETNDYVFSNHRCHGHFLAYSGNIKGLIGELMGKKTGVCAGIGSSQHLHQDRFFSNGIQGGIVPVSAGLALAQKLQENNGIAVVFIGDGTLGEGVLYETMNLASKWKLPLLIVCEHNQYAQSTHYSDTLAGDILDRARAFDIRHKSSSTEHYCDLMVNAKESIDYVRKNGRPFFHLIETYRLNAHSKGDDDRDVTEVQKYRQKDPLCLFEQEDPEKYASFKKEIDVRIENIVQELTMEATLQLSEYAPPKDSVFVEEATIKWVPLTEKKERMAQNIYEFFNIQMAENRDIVFLGEDVAHPYGGAFKVSKDLSKKYPDRVFSTPISEAAIVGMANGLALAGFRPFVEIMFGDFITLCMDQIVNHAAKFFHMYNQQVSCPLVVRTPMGARRGYGPTHSQTLDKLLIGVDNLQVFALNTFVEPRQVYEAILSLKHPSVVIENKADYGKQILHHQYSHFNYESTSSLFPVVRISPKIASPDFTLICYGGMADFIHEHLMAIFEETEWVPELLIPTQIHPLDLTVIAMSVAKTGRLLVVEEGTIHGGFANEVIAGCIEVLRAPFVAKRLGAFPVPIPSPKHLEEAVLVNKDRLIQKIKEMQ